MHESDSAVVNYPFTKPGKGGCIIHSILQQKPPCVGACERRRRLWEGGCVWGGLTEMMKHMKQCFSHQLCSYLGNAACLSAWGRAEAISSLSWLPIRVSGSALCILSFSSRFFSSIVMHKKKTPSAALRVITLCMREEEREAEKRRNANKKRVMVAAVCLGSVAVKEEKVSATKGKFGRHYFSFQKNVLVQKGLVYFWCLRDIKWNIF